MSGPWLAAFVTLWILVIVLAGLLLGLLRRVEGILTRAESHAAAMFITPNFGLRAGEFVPAFMGQDADGRTVDSSEVLPEAPLVFLFVEQACRPCRLPRGWDHPLPITRDHPSTRSGTSRMVA